MFLVNLYGEYNIEGALDAAFDGYNTVVLVNNLEDIPMEIRRWNTGDKKFLAADGSGSIRIGHEGSGLILKRNSDGSFTMKKYVPGWQPFYHSGTLQECLEWAKFSPFAEQLAAQISTEYQKEQATKPALFLVIVFSQELARLSSFLLD